MILFSGKKIISQNLNCKIAEISDHQSFIDNVNNYLPNGIKGDTSFKNIDAEIVYTSGSTGVPKGVVLSHSNLLNNSHCIAEMFQFEKSDNFLNITPTFHNSGQIVTILSALWSGSQTTSVRPEIGLLQFWYLVERFSITWSLGMPTHVNYLSEKSNNKVNSLKGFFCGGDKISSHKIEQFETNFKT